MPRSEHRGEHPNSTQKDLALQTQDPLVFEVAGVFSCDVACTVTKSKVSTVQVPT